MLLSSISSVVAVDALLVRDVDGQYRPARAEEVLSQARRVLRVRELQGGAASEGGRLLCVLLLRDEQVPADPGG